MIYALIAERGNTLMLQARQHVMNVLPSTIQPRKAKPRAHGVLLAGRLLKAPMPVIGVLQEQQHSHLQRVKNSTLNVSSSTFWVKQVTILTICVNHAQKGRVCRTTIHVLTVNLASTRTVWHQHVQNVKRANTLRQNFHQQYAKSVLKEGMVMQGVSGKC
jgi:hypothetical protein